MATRGRPVQKTSNSDRVTIIFNDNEIALIERIRKIASENNKSTSDIIRNILKIGIECYDLGFNIGFDGKLIKSEIKVLSDVQKTSESIKENIGITKDNNKKESIFME